MDIIKIQPQDLPLKDAEPVVLVLGFFDGLHLGHKALFDEARRLSEELEGDPKVAVFTFPESPQIAFKKFTPDLMEHIASPETRAAKFKEFGVDRLYFTDFTSKFANTSSDEFITLYLHGLNAQAIVVGFDYTFGNNRTGSEYLAKNFDGQVVIVPELQLNGAKVSSSRIRQALNEGDVATVNRLLGYDFTTRGVVTHGDARGRTLGFPTANLVRLDRTRIPSDGVYVVDTIVQGQRYRGMASVGENVTFDGKEQRLEVNILDFPSQEIYGETIEVIWLDKIRDMVKFDGIQALIATLENDRRIAQQWSSN
jgi:riboflavin kinase/FMN adenylyltransferase